MICKNCGAEVKENAKFCPSCGKSLTEEQKNIVQEPPKKGGIMKTVGKVIGGLVILCMIGSCMSGNKDTKTTKTTSTPAKVVAQFNPEQVKFLQSVGISEPKVTNDNGKTKNFTSKGNNYRLYLNDNNGIVKVCKLIGEKEWYVWTDDHGKWNVPANDGKYIIIDIDDLNGQLKTNAARASKNYKGVDIKFTGWIANIDSDGNYISVRGQDRYAFLHNFYCSIKDKKHKEVVINKNQGSKVTIKGRITDVGEVLGYRVRVDEIQ